MSLGAKIKQLRQDHGMSQGDLARKANLTDNLSNDRGYISNIENGKIKNVGAATIVKFAAAFEISEDILFEAAGLKTRSRAKGIHEEKEELIKFLNGLENLSPKGKKFIEDAINMTFGSDKN